MLLTQTTKQLISRLFLTTAFFTILAIIFAQNVVYAAIRECDDPSSKGLSECLQQNPIVHDIQIVVDFLSAAVAVVVVGVIILGGIQYAMAGNNPNAVTAAKQRITNGLIALVGFILTFAFLQWIIPGGVFN